MAIRVRAGGYVHGGGLRWRLSVCLSVCLLRGGLVRAALSDHRKFFGGGQGSMLAFLCKMIKTATVKPLIFMFSERARRPFQLTHLYQLSVNPDSAQRLNGRKHLRILEWEMSRFLGA